MTRPELTAALDQADAAGAHGAAIMAAIAEHLPAELHHEVPTGPERDLLRRFLNRAAAGQLDTCPHLGVGPEPVWWIAWRPGRLRCAGCAARAARSVRGTREDRRCDACQRVRSAIHPGAAQLPPVVVDLPGLLASAGPVTAIYGLCPACHTASTGAVS